jgi:hypothetical protein
MSKRFGRNQKRKLKAELAESNKALVNQINTSQAMQKERRCLERDIKNIIELVERFCYNSAAIPPKLTGHTSHSSYRLPMGGVTTLYEQVTSFIPTDDMGILRTIDVYKLDMYIADYIGEFSKCVHLKFGDIAKNSYAMSMDAFSRAPADYVAHNITVKLVTDLQKTIGKER